MKKTSDEMQLNFWPISFRVIGYGESTCDLIKEIQDIGYDGLQADTIGSGETITPTSEDNMLIVLCSDTHAGLEEFLNSFHQAGVLTIVISTDELNIASDSYDSLTVTDRDKIVDVVKTLLYPVFYQGRINYDFNDLAHTLRDSKRFITFGTYGCGQNRMRDAVASLSKQISYEEGIEDLVLIIYYNESELKPPLSMQELNVIMEYISKLPESVNVVWALYNDEALDSDTIGLSVITGGKI